MAAIAMALPAIHHPARPDAGDRADKISCCYLKIYRLAIEHFAPLAVISYETAAMLSRNGISRFLAVISTHDIRYPDGCASGVAIATPDAHRYGEAGRPRPRLLLLSQQGSASGR